MKHLLLLLGIFVFVVSAKECDITTYGAKGDDKTDNTKAIQAAINDCTNGGTVTVPAGQFMTYPLSVGSGNGFTFQFSKGGTLRAGSMSGWPVKDDAYVNFLSFEKCNNCTLTGQGGLIDGGGTPWYIAFDQGQLKYHRPVLVHIDSCTNFRFTYLHILNAPEFNVVLNNVNGAEVAYLNITDEWYNGGTKEPHNTDGIDPGGNSNNIHIHDCYIYNGDDSVAVKPGTEAGGCTRNILVENCQFFRGHGCSIGSVGSGCVKNVVFRNIQMTGQLGGANVKTYNDGPGYVQNITWQDITLENTDQCININTNYKSGTGPAQIKISDLYLTRITGTNCNKPAQFICQQGLPCTDIQLNTVNVAKGAKQSNMVCEYAHGTAVNVDPASCLLK